MTQFWLDNYKVLQEDIKSVIPNANMNLEEKLNAIFRLSLLLSGVMLFLTCNMNYIYIPLLVGVFTVVVYKTQKDSVETFFSYYNDPTCSRTDRYIGPSSDNPFMNFNNITDDRDRPQALKSYDNPVLQEEIEEKFDERLYRDVGDLYAKNNSQREFYTMPNTEVMNNQTGFAKWLYSTDATCKEDTTKCAPYSDLL